MKTAELLRTLLGSLIQQAQSFTLAMSQVNFSNLAGGSERNEAPPSGT